MLICHCSPLGVFMMTAVHDIVFEFSNPSLNPKPCGMWTWKTYFHISSRSQSEHHKGCCVHTYIHSWIVVAIRHVYFLWLSACTIRHTSCGWVPVQLGILPVVECLCKQVIIWVNTTRVAVYIVQAGTHNKLVIVNHQNQVQMCLCLALFKYVIDCTDMYTYVLNPVYCKCYAY